MTARAYIECDDTARLAAERFVGPLPIAWQIHCYDGQSPAERADRVSRALKAAVLDQRRHGSCMVEFEMAGRPLTTRGSEASACPAPDLITEALLAGDVGPLMSVFEAFVARAQNAIASSLVRPHVLLNLENRLGCDDLASLAKATGNAAYLDIPFRVMRAPISPVPDDLEPGADEAQTWWKHPTLGTARRQWWDAYAGDVVAKSAVEMFDPGVWGDVIVSFAKVRGVSNIQRDYGTPEKSGPVLEHAASIVRELEEQLFDADPGDRHYLNVRLGPGKDGTPANPPEWNDLVIPGWKARGGSLIGFIDGDYQPELVASFVQSLSIRPSAIRTTATPSVTTTTADTTASAGSN